MYSLHSSAGRTVRYRNLCWLGRFLRIANQGMTNAASDLAMECCHKRQRLAKHSLCVSVEHLRTDITWNRVRVVKRSEVAHRELGLLVPEHIFQSSPAGTVVSRTVPAALLTGRFDLVFNLASVLLCAWRTVSEYNPCSPLSLGLPRLL